MRHLVTRQRSGGGSGASSPDGPGARPAPAGRWPSRGSSPVPWARPASVAGWPGGRRAGSSAADAGGCAGLGRITGRSCSTCAAGWRSWSWPDRNHLGPEEDAPEEDPREEEPGRKKTICGRGWKKTPKKTQPKKTCILKPVDLTQFQNGDDTRVWPMTRTPVAAARIDPTATIHA